MTDLEGRDGGGAQLTGSGAPPVQVVLGFIRK